MYVTETGSSANALIVFLHGGGLSGRMWEPQTKQLAGYRCIVPDLPEQGRSAPVAPFSLDDAAARVAHLLETGYPGRRAHFVGLSLGGAVALTVLRRTPHLVERVVVSGTAAGFGPVLGAISKWSAALYRFFPPDTLANLAVKQFGIPRKYESAFRDDLLVGMKAQFVRNYTDALMGMRLPTDTNTPVLVAVGQRETWAAKRAARHLVAAIPRAVGVVVPRAGHVWNLEFPALFTATVRAWLEQTALPDELLPL